MDENKIVTVVEINAQQAQQELVKLNATVSNTTKTLEERITAKNRAIEIQNELSKRTINALENERRTLEGRGAQEKYLKEIFDKLNKAKLDALKISETSRVQLEKLNKAEEKSIATLKKQESAMASTKSVTGQLDEATGGLLKKFQLLMANPLILTVTLLVGAFYALKNALESNEEGQNKLAKISAVLGSVISNVTDLVAGLAMALIDIFSGEKSALKAAENFGKKVWDFVGLPIKNIITIIETAGNVLKAFWENGIEGANDALKNGAKEISNNFKDAASSITSAKNAISDFTKEAKADAKKASEIADMRAKADYIDNALIVKRAQADNKVAVLREKAVNKEKYSSAERIKFLKEAGKIEEGITNQEIASAKLRATAIVEENKLSGTNKANADAEQEALAKVIQLKTKQLNVQRSLTRQTQSAINEDRRATKDSNDKKLADQEKYSKEALELKKRQLQAEINLQSIDVDTQKKKDPKADTLEAEKEILNKRKELELLSTNLLEEEKLVIKQRYISASEDLDRKADEVEKLRLSKKNAQLLELDIIELERKKALGEETLDIELDLLARKKEQDLQNIALTEEEKTIIEQQYIDIRQQAIRDDFSKKLEDQIEYDAQVIAQKQANGEVTFALEKELRERQREEELSDLSLSQEAKAAINLKYDTANTESKQKALDQDLSNAGEAFGISKEIKMAQMIMSAPEAIGNSFTKASEVYPAPLSLAMGAMGAAGVVVPIIKGLNDIKKTRFPGKQPSRGNSGGAISASTGVSQASVGNIAANNIAKLGIDPSIKAGATAQAADTIMGSSDKSVNFSEGSYKDFQNQVEFKENKSKI